MPNLEVYITSKRLLERTLAFAKGVIKSDPKWNVKVVPIKKFLQDGFSKDLIKGDAIATWGILRGTGVLLKEAEQRKIDYYYMDHSYFKTENKEEEWYRIVKNNHSCTSLKRVSNQRWIKYFTVNNKCMPWKNQGICGSNILICPPTHAVSWYKNLKYNWCDYIVNQLKDMLPKSRHTNIKIRLKPNEPIVNDQGDILRLELNENNTSLKDDLNNCHCVIAYNSNVALQATLMGIPVIVGDMSPCKPISYRLDDFKRGDKDLFDHFNREPKNRMNLLYWLANNQWKLSEIEKGIAWKMLKKNGL